MESICFVFWGAEHRLNLRHHRVLREIEEFGALLVGSFVSSLGAFVHEVIFLAEVHTLSILQAGVLRGGRHGQFSYRGLKTEIFLVLCGFFVI